MHGTEDRAHWFALGCEQEAAFVADTAPRLGARMSINPAKATDEYAIDLLWEVRPGEHVPTDLKTQSTPFFSARTYGKDPGRTVTFNFKDLRRYERHYPQARVLFHVNWTLTQMTLRGQVCRVPPLHGVWWADIPGIRALVNRDDARHAYQRRVGDTQGNARDSYLLALDDLTLLGLLPLQT
ncbi:hypothetical protein [Deinococcus sp.]|uniref:hypothetical protein n=1 Tax=Deinococcus sp. TaxID=47478 RepID=UPI002869E5B5|nr:hypothetical protein [Deinococcus sp.]